MINCITRPVHIGHLLTSQTTNVLIGITLHYKIVILTVADGPR